MDPLKLKNDVVTRWNSTYDMINRVLKMKNPIISTLAILGTTLNEDNDLEVGALQNEEWIIAEQSINILEIFEAVTTAISFEQKVSASTVIFYYKQITKHLNTFDLNALMPPIENMVKKLQLELSQRFHKLGENNLIAQSTILDPRFKKFGFIDERKFQRAVENLYTKVANTKLMQGNEEIINESNDEQQNQNELLDNCTNQNLLQNLWEDFDREVQQHSKPTNLKASAIVEVDKYLEEPILCRKDVTGMYQDPLRWWHQRRHIYPKLYQIMKTRLCIMATSVPCERIFSKAGQTVNEKRERLKTDKISQVLFLSYNLNNKD